VAVPKDALQMTGETLRSVSTRSADSGAERERWFCSGCGSPIATIPAEFPAAVIKAGTLEDASGIEPSMEIWTETAHPWWESGGDRALHERGFPQG
jgi:hypothetical protein